MNALWINAIIGGALIGLASGGLMLGTGRIAGVSGAFGGLVSGGLVNRGTTKPVAGETAWRLAFVLGLIATGMLLMAFGAWTPAPQRQSLPLVIAAGLLVGIGTTLANGCTSGHGVCGIARLSVRSLTAVATFLGTGFAATYVLRHLIGSA